MALSSLKLKQLERGFVRCDNCGEKLSLDSADALQINECSKCGSPVFYPLKIHGYWLHKPLGGGGMGSVYLATGLDGKEYAVKVLPRHQRDNEELIDALLSEGEISMAIGTHRNVVGAVDFGEAEDEYFLALEYVEGQRLDLYLEEHGALPEAEAIDFVLQILAAERHIIERGYLFRDLKPQNILIEKGKRLRLFDYGLCIPVEEAASPHNVSTLEGSPYYIPPERVVGAPEGVYSETYSIGLLFYYMLSGKNYYGQDRIDRLVKKHVTFPRLPSVGSLCSCSAMTAKIIDKMIDRYPKKRYQSLDKLEKDLKRLSLRFENPLYRKIFYLEVALVVLLIVLGTIVAVVRLGLLPF